MAARDARRTALILGNYRPTLTIALRLQEAGYRVIVTEADHGAAGARWSRHVDEMWDAPPLEADDGAAFGAAIRSLFAARPDITTVFPAEEPYCVWVAKHQATLPDRLEIVSPRPELVLFCLDKIRMLETAAAAGVPCAPFVTAYGLDELHARAGEIGYPLIVRPFSHLNRLGHKKAVICQEAADLDRTFRIWPPGQAGLLLQAYVVGERRDVYFVADRGRVLAMLETRITRTDHPDGTGLSTEGQYVRLTPAFAEATIRLAARLDYHGIGFTQFVTDVRTGRTTFLELNPRTAGSHRSAEAGGLPLARAALALACGKALPPLAPAPEDRLGGRYAWVSGDLYGIREALRHREIGPARAAIWVLEAALSAVRSRVHLTWSLDDPLPSLGLVASSLLRQRRGAERGRHLEPFIRDAG